MAALWRKQRDVATERIFISNNSVAGGASSVDPFAVHKGDFWLNVEDYGAVSGTGVANGTASANRSAIQAAADAAPEGKPVWFPGIYEVDGPIEFRRLGRYWGPHVPMWNTSGATPRPRGGIRAHTSFAGTAIGQVRDKALTGQPLDCFGGEIRGLFFDGNGQLGVGIDGLLFAGLTDDWKLLMVEVFGCSGYGLHSKFDGTYQKILEGLRVFGRDNKLGGAYFDQASDFNFTDSQMNSNDGDGWNISASSSWRLSGCRAEWNADNGFRLTGALNKCQLIAPSTDRNEHHGIYVKDCVSNTPIQIVAPYTRRDGRNGNAGAGGFAGICVEGTAGGPNQPINVTGLAQRVGRDDDGTGAYSPQYGVKVDYVIHMNIEGQLWGQATALSDAGVSTVRVAPNNLYITGDPGSQVYSRGVMVEDNLDMSGGRSLKFDRVALQKTDGNSYIELPEQGSAGSADPGTPGAGKVRIFARDNGSGATDLRAKYDDGTGQPIQTGGPWQPLDGTLTALATQIVAADKIIYATGADAFAVADFTATARSLLDDTSLGAMRTTLGLVIGTDVEAHDATLTGIAGVAVVADRLIYATGVDTFAATALTSFMRTLLDDADAATARATLGLPSGTYTPTVAHTAGSSNLDGAPTAFQCQYMRVGNIVTVSGRVTPNPTTAGASTKFRMTLPVASNLGAVEDCGGTAVAIDTTECWAIEADTANDQAEFIGIAVNTAPHNLMFTFTYEVI